MRSNVLLSSPDEVDDETRSVEACAEARLPVDPDGKTLHRAEIGRAGGEEIGSQQPRCEREMKKQL